METRNVREYTLREVTIFVCPACGVVNPAGPSDGCPHLQLVRFDGVPEFMEDLLTDVAQARRAYFAVRTKLKEAVMQCVNRGTARVETPRKIKASDAAALYESAGFRLSHPEPPASKTRPRPAPGRASAGRRRPAVDPRQLDLLALSDSKVKA